MALNHTQFPHLFDTVEDTTAPTALKFEWPVHLPSDLLILSWADLLHAYTAVSDPVFLWQARAIQVDRGQDSWTYVQVNHDSTRLISYTSLNYDDPIDSGGSVALPNVARTSSFPGSPCAIELSYHPASGYGCLASACRIPESFLPQLLAQLRRSMAERGRPKDKAFFDDIALSVANPHRKVLPGPELLHQLLTEPSNPALAVDFCSANKKRTRLSYQDLDRLSSRLADRLQAIISTHYPDPATDRVVPIMIEQNHHLYIAQIAILKCGASFCPLNVDVPPDRLAFIVKDVGARVALTTATFRPRLTAPELSLDILLADGDDHDEMEALTPHFTHPARQRPSPESLAYVMYTSGSTGLPKGVGVSHRAVTQALLAHDEHVPRYSRFLQFAAPTFDVSVFEIFFTFYRGATLVSCYREEMLGNLAGMIQELSVDAAELTPTVALTLLRSWEAAPSLKLLLTIGEAISDPLIRTFAGRSHTGRTLLPVYGPTEASIHCMIQPEIKANAKPGTVGRPLSTVSALVIAEDQRSDPHVLPLGHVGELAIAGQLARGYLNRLDQTRMAFVHLSDYGLVYRTGDRARMLPSGDFNYLGRIAEGQVKIRGQRVELGEIEHVVCRAASVRLAVARLFDGNVIVFCLLEKGSLPTSASQTAIKDQCKAWLPSFMQPTELILMDGDLPRLPSGKIDQRGLEAHYLKERPEVQSIMDKVTDQLELLISDAIRTELDIVVACDENLRSRGLDSLRAIRLASRLLSYGVDISATDILSADTITDLSKNLKLRESSLGAKIESNDRSSDEFQALSDALLSGLFPLQRCRVDDILPCSQLQCAMLSESALSNLTNFNRITINVVQSTDPVKFVGAFCRLTHLNPILRSGFVHTSNPKFPYARIVWKALDSSEQIQWIPANLAEKHPQQSVRSCTLLRPLRLDIARSPKSTIVTIHIHHALYDGWSWDIIMADLESMLAGKELLNRPQFQQFVRCESARLTANEISPAHEYWTHQLRDFSPVSLPILTHEKSEHEILVNQKTIQIEVENLSQELRVSRHSIPSAVFGTLLHLYHGSTDLVYGSVSSGRTLPVPGIENIIGPCISTLPVRINFDRVHTVRDLVLHTDRLHHDFLHFGQMPLSDLQKIAGIPSDQALFDALFVWQEGLATNRNTALALSIVDQKDSLRYPFVFEVEPTLHQLHLKCTYDKSVMCPEQVEIFMNHFEALLHSYSNFPDAPWKDALENIRPEDLSIANAHFTSLDPLPLISLTVDRLAVTDPTRVAIEFVEDLNPDQANVKSVSLSYHELSVKAAAISRHLLFKGNMKDQLVCVFMDKSIPLYISILGILKAGAGYAVVDPSGPPERAHKIIEAMNCRYSLTSSHFKGHAVLDRIANVMFYDRLEPPRLTEEPIPATEETCLAYSVFTSGSTGAPKGVMITRQNIQSNIDVLSRIYPQIEDGALLQACSPLFDVSVFDILYTWHMGMRLCAAPNDILFRDLESFIRLLNITHLSLTPTVAAIVSPDNVPKVKMLVTAGEAVTAKVYADWSGRGLYQGYGPSETTNICSVHPAVSGSDHKNNVGQPLRNTSMFIFNDEGSRPLPKGGLGKIWIGGDQVGRGYLNNVDATTADFIHHHKYGRLYRSGDLGRMLPNGATLFYGRQDDQVKLRGQRIQLGAIEHALVQLPVVLDSVCLLVERAEPETRGLVAFWCSASASRTDPKAFVKQIFDDIMCQLPTYMVPDYLIHIDALPSTPQGKTDRKALQQLFMRMDPAVLKSFARDNDASGDADFQNEAELKVAGVLAEITGIPLTTIHRNTSFYALGIDSMTSINFARELVSLGFGQVDVSAVLRHSSTARLVRALSSTTSYTRPGRLDPSISLQIFDQQWVDDLKSNFAQKGVNAEKVLPSTPLQEMMISQVESVNGGAYHNQLTFSVIGDLLRLRAAWKTCVAAHEILRTAFTPTHLPQFPYAQVVLSEYEPHWSFDDDVAVTEIDEEKGLVLPPYCFGVFQQPRTQTVKLVLRIHHALYDGQAMSLLLKDVERAYRDLPLQGARSLGPYLAYMLGLDQEQADNFWQSHLAEYTPKLMSQVDNDQKTGKNSGEHQYDITSKLSLTAALNAAQQCTTSLLSLLQLAWARLLAYYSDKNDVCFGNVYSGRNVSVPDVDKIVGPCFNTLPVRVKLRQNETNQQALRRLHEHNLAAIRFQASSLRRIQRNQGLRQLFDTLLLLQAEEEDLDSSIWTLEEDAGFMGVPLIIEIVPNPRLDTLGFLLHSNTNFLSRDGLEAIANDFDQLLQHTVQYLDTGVTALSMLGTTKSLRLTPSRSTSNIGITGESPEVLHHGMWTEQEEAVLHILEKVSERELRRFNKQTTIFHLGFDSISAIQIAAELRRNGHKLTGGDVMEASTVPNIARLCSEKEPHPLEPDGLFDFTTFSNKFKPAICSQLTIDHQSVAEVRPCTPFQSSILAEFLRSNGGNYLSSMQYDLDDDIDLGRLRQKWDSAFCRHDILRTGFVEVDDVHSPFAMVLYRSESCQLPWIEHGSLLAQNVAEYGHILLQSLHQPPWRVSIGTKGRRKTMQLTMLHALFDAASLDIVLSEVSAAYAGGQLPEVLPIKPCLSRILQQASVALPSDISAPSNADVMPIAKFPDLNSHNSKESLPLKTELECSRPFDQLQACCREAGVTLQIAGQCAWARLLSFYTGESANTFGVVLTGRPIGDREEGVVFPYITTVPISISVQSTNSSLLKDAAGKLARFMKNPFALAQGRAAPASQTEAFDSLFVLQNSPSRMLPSPWRLVDEVAKVDYALSMEMIPNLDDKLHFRLNFLTKVIPLRQAELLVKQFNTILLDTLDHLDREASQILDIDKTLLSILPAKCSTIDTNIKALHQFVENTAHKVPHKDAFEFASSIEDGVATKGTWTYAELEKEANRIANLLQKEGAAVGDLVGICFEKCPQASFTILGVLKAGCAFVAVDPRAPEARKKFIFEDSGVQIVCTMHDQVDSLALKDSIVVLPVDQILAANFYSCHAVRLPREITSDDICYCLYTSGTTGTPKGCLITHGNAVQFILAFQRLFAGHWDSESRFLQFASFHFDVSVMEQFWSWSNGICVTSAPRDLLLEDLPAAIRILQITHIDLTPSLARLLSPKQCPSLCRGAFITGGEQLKQEIIDEWAGKGVLYNGYGPSEVTIGCTMYPRVPRSVKPSNIGYPYDNAGAHILHPHNPKPVLRGGIGELCVSGPLVGKGYMNRSELTAERFEYLASLGVRVYRTGDLVRLLHDGSICFVGRADNQVKLRGQRLEIGEINYVIRQTSLTIKDVATLILRHHEGSQEQLVTFIASDDGTRVTHGVSNIDADRAALLSRARRACTSALPGYMVPSHMVPLDTMPLGANNKVDEKSLQSLFRNLSAHQLQVISATDIADSAIDPDVLAKVVTAVCNVTRVPRKNIDTSSRLFELGIDSISVISLSRQLKMLGFRAANPSVIMKNPGIASLVLALTERPGELDDVEAAIENVRRRIAAFETKHRPAVGKMPNIDEDTIEKMAPCTPLQEGMISRHLNSNHRAYLSSFTFELHSPLDSVRLEAAWKYVAQQNEILRTIFTPTVDGYAQVVIRNSASCSTQFQHLSRDCDHSVKDIAREFFDEWATDIQNLEGDLWRVLFCQISGKSWMTLNIFHGLYDGNSLPLMLDEVAHAYSGTAIPYPKVAYHEMLPFGPLRPSFGAKEFWVERLNHIDLIELPRQHPNNGARVTSFNILFGEDIKKFKAKLDVTEAAIFQACWLVALREVFGVFPVIGVLVSGRADSIDGIENVVGPFFNTIPCRINASAASTMADLIKACHIFNSEAILYQHSALSTVSKWLGRKVDEPLFDSLFVFQKMAQDFPESRKLWQLIDSDASPHYPLALEVEQKSDGEVKSTIVAQSEYVSDALAEALSSTLKTHFHNLSENLYRSIGIPSNGRSAQTADRGADNGTKQTTTQKPLANGPISRRETFEWDESTKLMRSEIANLAGSDIRDVVADTSIFQLGLDSIDAIKLSTRLKAANIRLTVSSIMQAGCIAGMAEKASVPDLVQDRNPYPSLNQAKSDLARGLEDSGMVIEDIDKVLPVTPLQEGMLANYGRYYSQDVLKISDDVNIEDLKNACHRVVSTHDILRTRFVEIDDRSLQSTFVQVVHRHVDFRMNTEVLHSQAELQGLLRYRQENAISKGVSQPPLWLTLAKIGSDILLIVGISHALYDGWSIDLLHKDIATCYGGGSCERPSYEPVLEQILGAVTQKSLAFWGNVLRDLCPRPFPVSQHKRIEGSMADRCEVFSEIALSDATAFCKAHSVTLQSLGLACWALVLARHLRSRDVCFGLVLAGRDTERANEMMFPTMNTVPVRIIIAGTKLGVVKDLHKLYVSITEYQHFPLRQARLLAKGSPSRLFDTLFIYQKRPEGEEQSPSLYRSINGLSTPEYPVNVELEVPQEKLVWRSGCSHNVFGGQGSEVLLQEIDGVLRSIIAEYSGDAVVSLADGWSICGLPTFKDWVESESLDETPHNAPPEETRFLPYEKILVETLAEIARIDKQQIKRSTSLYHMGLDSISAIKVSSALRRHAIRLPVGDMLTAMTMGKMAEAARPLKVLPRQMTKRPENTYSYVLDKHIFQAALERAEVGFENVETIFPCTAGQHFFLGTWQSSGRRLFYPTFRFLVKGSPVSQERINTAWKRLSQAIPMLRTSFLAVPSDDSSLVQAVLKSSDNPVVWVPHQLFDSQHVSCAKAHKQWSPVVLIAAKSEKGILLKLRIHHALYDGVSLPATMQAFEMLLNDPSSPLSYNRSLEGYAQYVRETTGREKQRAFWTSYLEGHYTRQRSTSASFGTRRVEMYRARMMGKDVTKKLQRWVEKNDLSLQALFLAAYAMAHARTILQSECSELISGVYLANRSHDHEGLSTLMAPVVNVVPLRIPAGPQASLLDSAKAVQRDIGQISTVENSTVSLQEIYEWTGVQIDLFVNFIKLPEAEPALETEDNSIVLEDITAEGSMDDAAETEAEQGPSPFANEMPAMRNEVFLPPIDIEAAVRDGALDVGVFAPADLLKRKDAEQLLNALYEVLLTCQA